MKNWIPPAAAAESPVLVRHRPRRLPHSATAEKNEGVSLLGVGGYLPERIVTNAELVREFPDIRRRITSFK